jgi:hypothetical protein
VGESYRDFTCIEKPKSTLTINKYFGSDGSKYLFKKDWGCIAK